MINYHYHPTLDLISYETQRKFRRWVLILYELFESIETAHIYPSKWLRRHCWSYGRCYTAAMSEADDDDISITSTAPSEQQSEYDVEKILAEVVVEGETKYLVKWANYPIERSNPEPKESFSNSETLETWEKEKRLIREGKREPFDLVAFDEQVEAAEQAKTDRKRRREAKRRRLGSGGRAELPQRDSRKPAPQSRPRPSSIATRPAPNSRILANGAVRSVADKPPMALFGNPRAAPTSGNRFQKKSSTQELSKIFNLSTKRKYEKAKSYEPAPDVNKLDLRRPSEWDSRSTIAARLGDRPSKPLAESQSTVVAKQSDGIVNPDPGSSAVTENHVTGSDGMDDLTSGKESASNQPFPLPQRGPRWNHLRVGDYWCNWGELLIHLFYGPEKIEIGPTRICGLASESIRKRLLDTKKSRRFDLWFQHVCTAEEYRLLRREVSTCRASTLAI